MQGDSATSVVMPHLNSDQMLQRQNSESTLSGKSSPRNRLRLTRSRTSALSEEVPAYDNMQYLPMNSDHQEADRDLVSFSERFRSLILQVNRETEEALAFARSESTSSHVSVESPLPPPPKEYLEQDIEEAHRHEYYDYEYDEDDFYHGSSSQPHAFAPNSYLQSYPEEERVRMLNGYIMRMPTIESMGSKEWRNSFGASSRNTDRERNPSRPNTGNTRPSFVEADLSGSEPRSRTNSLSAQAELLVGLYGRNQASEIGEIMRRGDTIRMVEHQQSANDDSSDALGDDFSLTSGSRHSYHTATTGSQSSTDSKVPSAGASKSSLPSIPTSSHSVPVEP